jgi:hypothetical protein
VQRQHPCGCRRGNDRRDGDGADAAAAADDRYPAKQRAQRRGRHRIKAVVTKQLADGVGGYPAEQGRQAGQIGEFGAARGAGPQVAVHQGALGRLDRAEQVGPQFQAYLGAGVAAGHHVRRPGARKWRAAASAAATR